MFHNLLETMLEHVFWTEITLIYLFLQLNFTSLKLPKTGQSSFFRIWNLKNRTASGKIGQLAGMHMSSLPLWPKKVLNFLGIPNENVCIFFFLNSHIFFCASFWNNPMKVVFHDVYNERSFSLVKNNSKSNPDLSQLLHPILLLFYDRFVHVFLLAVPMYFSSWRQLTWLSLCLCR